MQELTALAYDPSAWVALLTLIVLEVVLGVDNLVFVALLTNKLPETIRARARSVGLLLALVLRLVLLGALVFMTSLTEPVVTVMGHGFSIRDLIMVAGGLFLLWKSVTEIHDHVDPDPERRKDSSPAATAFAMAIVQILLLDLVFSIDSILTAVGMTNQLPIMFLAVTIAVLLMLVASGPLARWIAKNPTVVMLALGFLMMIGMVLIADGFGVEVPKTYIYVAMGFAAAVECLNALARRARRLRGPSSH
ncbi:MAG TPA: TerC family protein [Caulobacteraceae bacterium]|jgi:predicted tellurium resistance membrane protein TerC|nr:TerC family protein [Caulobacteraceae bacterium]